MKSKNEDQFTTLRIKKGTAKAIRKMCAKRLVSDDKVVHPYEIIDELLNRKGVAV